MEGPPDVHYEQPNWPYALSLVGLKGLKAVAKIRLLDKECKDFFVSVDAFTDLPPSMRGSNMSRSARIILKALEECKDPWEMLELIASTLLTTHEYATRTLVSLKLSVPDPSEKGVSHSLALTISRERGGTSKYILKASTVGMTVCPSALAVTHWVEGKSQTHTQRAILLVEVKCYTPPKFDNGLLEVLKKSFSATPKAYLTREAEGKLVAEAFLTPMFTEDVTRKALYEVMGYMKLTGVRGCCVKVVSKSHESVHPFDIIARGVACW